MHLSQCILCFLLATVLFASCNVEAASEQVTYAEYHEAIVSTQTHLERQKAAFEGTIAAELEALEAKITHHRVHESALQDSLKILRAEHHTLKTRLHALTHMDAQQWEDIRAEWYQLAAQVSDLQATAETCLATATT